jgi:hypothetical protein
MTVSLQILTDRNKVMLTWSDFKDLIFFSHRQNPNRYMLNLDNVSEFERNFHWWVREWQYILSTGAFNLTNNQTVKRKSARNEIQTENEKNKERKGYFKR